MSHCDDTARPPACPEEFLLLDFVLGRVDGETRERLGAHLGDCDTCRDAAGALEQEARAIRGLLERVDGRCPEPHRDALELAAYLDGALDAPARAECEAHLARCHVCQRELAALHREVEESWDPESPAPAVEHRPAAECIEWDAARARPENITRDESIAGFEKSKDQNGTEDAHTDSGLRRELS